jgi:hypothetical protein
MIRSSRKKIYGKGRCSNKLFLVEPELETKIKSENEAVSNDFQHKIKIEAEAENNWCNNHN